MPPRRSARARGAPAAKAKPAPKKSKAVEDASMSDSGDEDEVFAGLVFAVLIKSPSWPLADMITDNGGAVVASAGGKKVTHVVADVAALSGNKRAITGATKNGAKIVTDAYVRECVREGKVLPAGKFHPSGPEDDAEDDDDEEEEVKPAAKRAKRGAKAAPPSKPVEDAMDEGSDDEKPAKGRRGAAKKAAKRAAPAEDDDDDDADAAEEAPVAKSKSKAAKKGKAAADTAEVTPAPVDEKKVKVVRKGRAAVEPLCGVASTTHVYEAGKDVYDCMLNQTDISYGTYGHNKFYQIQLLQSDSGSMFYVWNRWGRVGEPGQNKLIPCSSLAHAMSEFQSKFKSKTANDWHSRHSFVPKKGKYTYIETDYADDPPAPEVVPTKSLTKTKGGDAKAKAPSKLHNSVQDFVKLIFDLKMMERTVVEMEYDIKKMPLGKLAKSQIMKGYAVLKELEDYIRVGNRAAIKEASSRFYTLIPHSFGRALPPAIATIEGIKNKLDMLNALSDIEIATTLVAESKDSSENLVDTHYKKLKAEIKYLDTSSKDYKIVEEYVKTTWERGTPPKIVDVFEIERQGERDRYAPNKKSLGNRKLLWHGSRLSNYVGIISQGLRIAPPEAPKSGYRFGKGIYFADMMSLSARYCRTYGSSEFVMILCDVALGKENLEKRDKYMEKPPSGTHSTKALGRIEPDPKKHKTLPNGCVVPTGKPVSSGYTDVSCHEHQYISYDVANVEMRYILRLRQ